MSQEGTITSVQKKNRICLTEVESKELLREAGIDTPEARLALSKEEATEISRKLGFPVVLKIASPDIIHKSDAGGVKLGLRTSKQVGKAYDCPKMPILGRC
jgi:4-hydroxybutyryl-CoA synthetase (ADP-forming)